MKSGTAAMRLYNSILHQTLFKIGWRPSLVVGISHDAKKDYDCGDDLVSLFTTGFTMVLRIMVKLM
jgi:hypothetical protein